METVESHARTLVNVEDKAGEIKSVLSDWVEKANDCSWMHDQSRRYYKGINYAYTISIILSSTIAGTANLVSAALSSTVDDDADAADAASVGGANAAGTATGDALHYLQYAIAFLGLGSAAASAIHRFIRTSELQEAHSIFASQFEKLAREIRVETLLSDTTTKTYSDIGVLLKEIQEDFDRLSEQAPAFPSHIERRLERKRALERQRSVP